MTAGFPIFWMLNTSITPTHDLYQGEQSGIPDFSRTFQVFDVLTGDSPFLSWMAQLRR